MEALNLQMDGQSVGWALDYLSDVSDEDSPIGLSPLTSGI